MPIKEKQYSTLEDAASALATDINSTLGEAVSKRGEAALAVSGGKTPEKVFKYLRKQKLDWNKVTLTLTDERWIPNDHPESNEKLVRSNLLEHISKGTTFIPFYEGNDSLEVDVKSCESRLKSLSLPFDAVYLGIGPDGHFASLFPGGDALNVSDSHCVGVSTTNTRLARISLTASAILNSRKIFILFSGADKHSIYQRAKAPGSPNEIPLRLVLSQVEIPVVVYYAP